MMYQVILNDVTPLYGVDIENSILSPSLEVELNSAGTFSFTLPPTHSTMTDNWYAQPDVLSGEIDVYEGDNIVWFGRPLEVARDWNNQKVIKCEGALAYFNDTVQRPKEFDKQWWLYEDPTADPPITKGFINYIIEEHNKQVTANHTIQSNREIILGNVTVDNDRVYRQTDYNTTADALQQMCLDTDGGYFILRKEYVIEDGNRVAKRYLDWTKDVPGGTGQPAAFGLNLLELNQDLNGADIVTVLIPTGEDDILINNSTLWNDTDHLCPHNSEGFTFLHNPGDDELTWKEGYDKYGRILKQKDWSDISEKSNLQQRACEWMRDQNEEPVTVECTAADLHYLKYPEYQTEEGDQKYDPFFVGEKVQVVSSPHGLTKELPIYKISINLDSGVKRMSIGTPPKRELTDIVKTGGGSTRGSSGTSGTSSGDSGGSGGSVTIPVKDVRVKKAGEEVYKSVVKKKIAKIDLSDLGGGDVSDVKVDGTSVVDQEGVANVVLPLTDVQIDDVSIVSNKIANIDSSQFGTTVVANPSDTPTDDLTSIKIGSTVYDIPGGGGGGGARFKQELIYDTPVSTAGNITVSNFSNADSLTFVIGIYASGDYQLFINEVPMNEFRTGEIVFVGGTLTPSDGNTYSKYACVKWINDTTINLVDIGGHYWAETGYLYRIYKNIYGSTIINNPVSLSDYYDTTEQVVGRWTDGKPLYQKTIHVNGPLNSGNNSINHDISNLGEVVLTEGTCKYNNTNEVLHLPYISLNTNYNIGFSNVDTTRFMIYIGNGFTSVEDINITLQYTKTTDTPGTGPVRGTIIQRSDIYSTEERQIGRWTDGKPLYQKSYQISVDHSSAAPYYCQSYPHGISNIDPNSVTFKASIITNQGVVRPLAFNFGTSDPSAAVLWNGNVFADDVYLNFELGSQLRTNSDTIIVTIQYTKTTDIAGTGLLPDEPTHIAVASCYSEDEQVVGRWTDGKPLYQKTSIVTTTGTTDIGYDVGLDSTMNVIDYDVLATVGGNKTNINYYMGVNDYCNSYLSSDMLLHINPASNWSGTSVIVTFRYTKTTDVPNTGPIVGNLRYLPTIYSEQEREIGVWTDGKPLYQKSVHFSTPITVAKYGTNGTLIMTVPNIEQIVFTTYSDFESYSDEHKTLMFWTEGNEVRASDTFTHQYYSGTFTDFTIQYTKTTDTPGSGTWTPEGQLAHHYSTSEHIVGTWIDGSTIYERTWDFGSDVTVSTNWGATTIPNTGMDKCIRCEAMSSYGANKPNIEADLKDSGGYVKLAADGVSNNVRYLTLRYTKT